MVKKNSTALADLLFPTENDQELSDSILSIKPEQRRLHTDTYDFTVLTLLNQFEDEKIYIPNYQRKYVWPINAASRLIESLIIQCPIPVIYLAQEKDERLAVVDGNQRLNSLSKYFNNEFKLTGLTAYPELEGFYYKDLDERIKRHIGNRTIRCMVILKETHPQVKFDVFERLNTGSVKLTPQELRHGIYYGTLMKNIGKIASNKIFTSLLCIKNEKRMKSEELVIRYLAFRKMKDDYEKPLVSFLNKFSEEYKNIDADDYGKLENEFIKTAQAVNELYGKKAFQIWINGKMASAFNAALFDAEMHLGYLVSSGKKRFVDNAFEKTMALIERDKKFSNAITRATSDKSSVEDRFNIIGGL